jgi:NADPH2:quinone reductase
MRMKAIGIREPGGPDVLHIVEADVPRLRAGEILIRVEAAGVNRPDLSQRAGRYPVPADASPIPGLEVAGTVVEIAAGVADIQRGDRVMALVHGGGYAEFCAADHRHAMAVPNDMSMVEAAAFAEVSLTVEFNMVMRAGLRAGETMLVHGGSSGIGTHAVRRALSLGATAITTSRSREKSAYCRGLGAAVAINSSEEDWQAAVMAATEGRGVDVVLDMVGGEVAAMNVACMAEDGRYALISVQAGRHAKLDLEPVLRRRLTIVGSTLRPLGAEQKAAITDKVRRDVLPLVRAGQMRPHVCATFCLAEAAEAHRLLERGENIGKVVLTVMASGR